jgi:hypothetical protein
MSSTPTDNVHTGLITADTLYNLHEQHSALSDEHDNIAEQLNNLEQHIPYNRSAVAAITAHAVILIGAAHLFPIPHDNIIVAALLVVAVAITARAASRNIRQHTTLTCQLRNLRDAADQIETTHYHIISHPSGMRHDLQQLEQILIAAGEHKDRIYHLDTENLRDDLYSCAIRAAVLRVGGEWMTSPTLVYSIGVDNLTLIARWWHLAQHIAYTDSGLDADDGPLTYTAKHRHIAHIIRDTLSQYGTDTVATANTLAADDTDYQHGWNDLLNTAAAITR